MESIKSLIVAGIIILIIIAGGIFFYSKGNNQKSNSDSTSNQITQSATKSDQKVASGEQDIQLTHNGFTPAMLTVKTGTRVKWVNNSGITGAVDSDPYKIQNSYPAMNFGQFTNGSTLELVFDKPGTYHYHNYLNPSQFGTIVVQ